MNVIKLYLKYQLTLSNILIMFFLIVFLSISYYITSYDLNLSLSYEEVLSLYFENSLYYTKIIIIFLSCFLFMKLKNERNEYLINIIVTAGYTKKYNFIGMIISVIVFIFILIFIIFIDYLIIGFINMHFFEFEICYLYSFVNLFLISVHYGLLTYLVIQLTNNQLIFILILIMFLLADLVVNMDDSFKYIFLSFFPNLNNNTGEILISIIYILLNIIAIFIINLIIYIKNDLRG